MFLICLQHKTEKKALYYTTKEKTWHATEDKPDMQQQKRMPERSTNRNACEILLHAAYSCQRGVTELQLMVVEG